MDEPGLLTDQAATCRLLVHAHVCSDVPSLHLKCFLVQFLTENNTIMKKINFVHLPVCARTNMEKDQTPGPTTASLYQHMLETDLADMVARQDLQPTAMGEDRANTNHRLHRTEEMEMDWTHPANTTAQYSQTSPSLESSRHQAKRKTQKHLAQNPRH